MSWKTNCSWNTKLINYIHAQWLKAHVIQSSPCVVQVDSESVVTWWMVQTAAAAAAISIALFPSIHPSIQMLPATSAASDFHPYFHLRVFKGLPQVQKKKAWFSCTWRIRLSVTVNVKHVETAGLKSWQSVCTACRLGLDSELWRLQATPLPSSAPCFLINCCMLHAPSMLFTALLFFLQVKLKKVKWNIKSQELGFAAECHSEEFLSCSYKSTLIWFKIKSSDIRF